MHLNLESIEIEEACSTIRTQTLEEEIQLFFFLR